MNMKNTAILLILLLSIVGLIIGVHYTNDDSGNSAEHENEINIDGDNPTIIIHFENQSEKQSLVDRIKNFKIE